MIMPIKISDEKNILEDGLKKMFYCWRSKIIEYATVLLRFKIAFKKMFPL